MAGLGGISLHHYRPKVPNIGHGTILRTFQPTIATRTLALMREAQLEFGRQLEKVKADIERDIGFEINLMKGCCVSHRMCCGYLMPTAQHL